MLKQGTTEMSQGEVAGENLANSRSFWQRKHGIAAGAVVASVLILGGTIAQLAQGWNLRQNIDADQVDVSGGALLICGGGELPDVLRRRFWQLAGGRQARIVLIPSEYTTANHRDAKEEIAAWKSLGVASIDWLSASNREEADQVSFAEDLQLATGVWLGGGDQSDLSTVYANTETEHQLRALLERGGVIGGNSAGAAVMSRVMIACGSRSAVKGEGLGLFPGVVIDQHFLRRNRVQRLLGLVSEHPELVGFGIDERTALQVQLRDLGLSIVGESYVMACVPAHGIQPARIEIFKHGDETTLDALRGWNPEDLLDPEFETDEVLTSVDLDEPTEIEGEQG